MKTSAPKTLSWPEVLAALRECTGASVLIRDGNVTEPAAVVRNRPAARGTELCLFPGERGATRPELIGQLEALAGTTGRRFSKSARARIGSSYLLVESVGDETLNDVSFAVIRTRRPVLGFNQGRQRGDSTTLRSKRIKNR